MVTFLATTTESAGLPSFTWDKGPNDSSGPWHCKFGSDHAGIRQFAFTDGHVALLSTSVDINILNKLAVKDDGMRVDGF